MADQHNPLVTRNIASGLTRRVRRRIRNSWIVRNVTFTTSTAYDDRHFRRPIVNGYHVTPTEPELYALLRNLLPACEGVFVDVGANLGQTLAKVKVIDPGRHYLGFEPDPFAYNYLGRLAVANGWQGISLVPIALGEEVGMGAMSKGDGVQDNRVVARSGEESSTGWSHVTPVLPGDTVIENLGLDEIGILKIDVEGAEMSVLRGFQRTIKRLRPLIVIEILPPQVDWPVEKNRERIKHAEAIGRFALDHNYSCRHMTWSGRATMPVDLLQGISTQQTKEPLNYLLLPDENELIGMTFAQH
jgi:FkbM family methyltransferase